MSFLSRTGWIATADSQQTENYPAQNAIDNDNDNFWWSSSGSSVRWFKIDFGSSQSFNCIWWQPRNVIGYPGGPSFTRVYKSDNDSTWIPLETIYSKNYQVWPGNKLIQLFHSKQIHTARYIKIMTSRSNDITCEQMQVGVVSKEDPYKKYYVAYPLNFDSYPGPIECSIIDVAGRMAKMRVWKTFPLGPWPQPELFSDHFRIPSDVERDKDNIESIVYVAEADTEINPLAGHYNTDNVGTTHGIILKKYGESFGLQSDFGSGFAEWPIDEFDIVESRLYWQYGDSVEDRDGYLAGKGRVHIYNSVGQQGDPDDDYSYLWYTDHYLMIVIPRPPIDAFMDSATSGSSFAH